MRFRVDPLPSPGTYRGTAMVVGVIRATTNGTRAAHAALGARPHPSRFLAKRPGGGGEGTGDEEGGLDGPGRLLSCRG